jgi:hypothetical protein
MKTIKLIILSGVLVASLVSCSLKDDNGAKVQHFGDSFKDIQEVSVSDILKEPNNFYRKEIIISGVIERQCPSSGCWLFLKDDLGSSIRVELSDYFPKLPISLGKFAVIEGEIVKMGDKNHQFVGTKIAISDVKNSRKPNQEDGESCH